jgi:hypothetical protein
MEKKIDNLKLSNNQTEIEAKNDPVGYPLYPNKDDIYNRWKEEMDIDPEDISKMKEVIDEDEIDIKEELNEGTFGGDLDVPGAELDDDQEDIGSEDEENNYYSIGSDNHNNLEEHNR